MKKLNFVKYFIIKKKRVYLYVHNWISFNISIRKIIICLKFTIFVYNRNPVCVQKINHMQFYLVIKGYMYVAANESRRAITFARNFTMSKLMQIYVYIFHMITICC